MTSRLFTFGCSFTHYHWPTWADILGKEFNEHQNWGKTGAGNLFILCSLMEAIQKESISSNDTVAIMWTSIGREDRWVNGEWLTLGSIYNQEVYSKKWVEQFADPTGYLIRDMALITAAIKTLENIGCKYHMMSLMPFDIPNDASPGILSKIRTKFNLWSGAVSYDPVGKELGDKKLEIFQLYDDVISKVKPSVFEIIFNNDWYSREGFRQITWAESSYRENIETWAPHWPPYEEFIKGEVSKETADEIKQCYDVDDIKEFVDEIKRFENRDDIHPTPLEHLEYLDKVLTEITVSDSTRIWVEQQQLNAEKGIRDKPRKVDRL